MTMRHLWIFLAICENGGNVTKAAQALGIAQPAASLAPRELEDYYGDDMEADIRNWDAFGVLRVGSSISIGQQLLSSYVSAFMQLHPGTDVQVRIDNSEAIENMILHNSLDLALIEGLIHSPEIAGETYLEDELALVCSPEIDLPDTGPQKQAWLCRQRLLLREPGSGTRDLFDAMTAQAGMELHPSWESTDSAALLNAAIAGLGLAALPLRLVREAISRGQVQLIQVEGLSFRRKFRIIHHRQKFLTPLAKDFIRLCREYGDA